jgi:hypothetical protein
MALALRGMVIGAAVLAASMAIADSGHSHMGYPAGDVGIDGSGVRVVELDMTEGNGTMAYSLSKIEVSQNETVRFG